MGYCDRIPLYLFLTPAQSHRRSDKLYYYNPYTVVGVLSLVGNFIMDLFLISLDIIVRHSTETMLIYLFVRLPRK